MKKIKIHKLIGTKKEWLEQFRVAVAMFFATAIYAFLSHAFAAGYQFNLYEFLGTWTGLVCVWLSRTENILCWPWGIASSAILGFFFMQVGLPGQQWLNWVYFVLVQIWAWPHWAFGGKELEELPISRMSVVERSAALFVIILGTVGIYSLIDVFVPGSLYPWMDALVVSASIVAQYLLGRKKVESWILWLGPVNMLSIVLFFLAGAYTLTALYVAFFAHAAFALKAWGDITRINDNKHVS